MIMKIGKVVAGTVTAAIAAELVAIGMNAAIDDCKLVKKTLVDKASPKPEPVKRGFFGKKKGGK